MVRNNVRWNKFSAAVFMFQSAMIILFATCVEYDPSASPRTEGILSAEEAMKYNLRSENKYTSLQDIQVLVIVGFGFLYSLMRRYAWSGVSYSFLIAVLCIQWSILCSGFWKRVQVAHAEKSGAMEHPFPKIPLEFESFIDSHFIGATVLISVGTVLGRMSPTQKVLLVFIEVITAAAYLQILVELKVTDPGGSMSVHVFGAAFGLALALAKGDAPVAAAELEESIASMRNVKPRQIETAPSTSTERGTVAMIGTLFLFVFWPSFNSGFLEGPAAARAAMNTILSISASCASVFGFSRLVRGGKRLDMEHVANSTVAGGVIMGTACDMISNPGGAILCGFIAGAASTISFTYAQPALKRAGCFDALGVFSLHMVPGFLGGIVSAIAAACIHEPRWSHHAIDEFPGRKVGRSAVVVGGYQMLATVIALVFGALAGLFTGWLCRFKWTEPLVRFCLRQQEGPEFYNDSGHWHVPEDVVTEVFRENSVMGINNEPGHIPVTIVMSTGTNASPAASPAPAPAPATARAPALVEKAKEEPEEDGGKQA